MERLSRDKLIHWLLLLSCLLLGLAFFVLLCEAGAGWLGRVAQVGGKIALPFVVAWILARLSRPLIDWLEKHLRMPRPVAALLITLLLLVLVVGLVWMLYAIVVNVLSDVADLLSQTDAEALLSGVYQDVEQLYSSLGLDTMLSGDLLGQTMDKLTQGVSRVLMTLLSLATSTPQLLIIVFITLIATYYWCRDEAKVNALIDKVLPGRGGRVYVKVTEVVAGYVRLLLILVLVAMVISVAGLYICGAKNALALGLLVGCANIVPSFGPAALLLPWALWMLLQGKAMFALGLLLIWGLIIFSRYLILPRLMGDSMGLHPLATLASLFVGLMLFGVVGIVLGPVILAVAVALVKLQGRRAGGD